jgi:predicted regulator of Ras-like GTPase activity (Roadblock/LC7/MglB family)
MSNELYAFALKNMLSEIKNSYPTISHALVLKDAEAVAVDENTDDDTTQSAINAIEALIEHANTIGDMENATIHSTNGKISITHINDFYLASVFSKETDEKQVNTLTQSLLSIVLKLVAKIHPASINESTFTMEKTEPPENNITKLHEKELPQEATSTVIESEPILPKPPVNQFIVETLSGLLAPSDTVRIDNAVLAEWKNLYANKKIETVELETLTGKTTRCKYKPIKGSKQEGKGTIQIPEKIQLALQTTKGELVTVKPVIE